ncbi:MAG: hypothetical protein A3I05_07360 [Deltaproteobacteria bacterium RIFCSPLOWO2_02_FULL_44_10]|nr:MAG: hypothetical protein A3C46_04340 [Deltaproteobacteria bacterium RIFCSPHIGHO2_02_FULL_44_16]OGQ46408.1 MAG: hypothetical protein A3I05_07360 [Deltaproteobacteria bacterium RIFCSPLOWO2_02_FULL_44_10]
MSNHYCAACHKEISPLFPIGRGDECPHCHADLHACRQCRFFDLTVSQQCREPQAEFVSNKEKANFCGYFEFCGKSLNVNPATDAKRKLDDLFRK